MSPEQPRTLPAALRRAAERFGEHTAVEDGDRSRSYRELLDEVRRIAAGYVHRGVRPGDRIAVWAPNSLEWVVAALAISYAGASLVPLNTRYRGHEVVDVLERTSATVLVLADGFLGRSQLAELREAAADTIVAEADGPVRGLPALHTVVTVEDTGDTSTLAFSSLPSVASPADLAEAEGRATTLAGEAIADILFTSGTTGRSKGVLSTHAQTIEAARRWGENCRITDQDSLLVINPFFHSFGYKAGLTMALLFGCAVYPQATFDVDTALDLIAQKSITVLPGPPTVFTSLLAAERFDSADLGSLRLAVTGAAIVPVHLVERLQRDLEFEHVITAFGMTECVTATMCRPGDPDELVAGTCGRAVPGVEIRIIDPDRGTTVPAGEDGEIQLRGAMVTQGYLDDPAATAEAIDPEGWLRTGDIGRVDENGYLTITDRLKDMYISGGFNVYPAEVEHVLSRLDGVVESAVVGRPDDRMGEVGRAYIVRGRDTDLSADDVIGYLRDRVANFKVPRDVIFVADLPRNAAGKVSKNELRSEP